MTLRSRTHRPLLVTLAAACAVLLLAPAAARAGWRESKAVFGGQVNRVVADAGGTLYTSTTGGLLQSADGGQTWGPTPGALPTTNIYTTAPDPVEVGVLYVSTDLGLYRTADAGSSWARLPLNLPVGVYVNNIAVAPTNRNHVFVSTWGAYVYRSLDRGATWEQRGAGLSGGWGGPAFTTSMAVDPSNASRVYTSTWRGYLFRSDDAATTWTRIADAGTWANGQIYVARSAPHVLYTTHDEFWFGRGTILKSTDYGNNWSNAGRPNPSLASDAGELAIDPADPNVVYASSSLGVHKTTTGGGSWPRVFSPAAGQTYMASVAVEAGNAARVYAGSYYSGFYRSPDSGVTWTQHNTGIASASVTGLDISRSAPSVIYMGAQNAGFFKSADGGLTWNSIGAAYGFPGHSTGPVSVNPQNPDSLVLMTSFGGASRIWRSLDGGATFAVTNTGYGPSFIRHNRHNPNLIHGAVSDWQGGFILSNNAGASWFVPYFWYIYPNNFDFHPSAANFVFGSGHQYTGAALNTAHVMWSNNAGSSWAGVAFGQGNMNDVALDKNSPNVLYVAGALPGEGTRGVYKFNVNYAGGSVASVTRLPGTFNAGLPNPTVRRLAYDPANGYLYASTPNGVYRSNDQAATWTSINAGLPYPSTELLALTPDGSRLYVGTSAGVWEYSDSLPVAPATPTLSTSPAALMQQAVKGEPFTLGVLGETTTAADAVVLSASSPLPANMTFSATSGNPAAGTLSFTPDANQEGETYAVTFTATSTLDPTKSATLTRHISVVNDPATDTSALISTNSSGVVSTPDGGFRMDLAAGSIPSETGLASVNVISDLQSRTEGARVEVAGRRGRARVVASYDITINGQIHFTFAQPVALTFRVEPGAVSNLADVKVMVYNEATGLYEQRTDTSCLASFGLQPYTGSAAAGGTVSVCTTTVSLWAAVDLSSFMAESCDADPTQPACPQGCVQPPAGLLGWWPGEGNALDVQGPGFEHGTLRNGAGFAAGKVGQAFDLDGVDDYVSFGDIFDGLNGGFTLGAWIKTTATVGNKVIVAKYWTTGSSWLMRTNEDDPRRVDFTVCSPDCTTLAGHAVQLISTSNINDGGWHFIAAAFDGSTQRLYVDGVLEASETNTNPAWPDNHHFCIGAACGPGGEVFANFSGLIDEVEIFDRALSQAEIQSIYDAGGYGKCRPEPANTRPVADAGPDLTIECAGALTTATLDGRGSSDPDGDTPLSYSWSEGATPLGTGAVLNVNLGPGTHAVTLTVTDPGGLSATDTVSVNIQDTQPPVVNAPPAVNASTGPGATSCGLFIPDSALGAATADDACGGQLAVARSGVPAGNLFPVGQTVITYTATDAAGHTTQATQTVSVTDDAPPLVTPPANINANSDANSCSALVSVGTAAARDNCGVQSIVGARSDGQPLGAPYPVGTTTVNWTVTDVHGNTASAAQTVTIRDAQTPEVTGPSASAASLWPPNHSMRDVAISYGAADNCGAVTCVIASVTSNEPETGTGGGDAAPDWLILGPHHVRLRAERAGSGPGRLYTVTVVCTDSAGNPTTKAVTVAVPKSQGR